MRRYSQFSVLNDTSLFSSSQILVRSVLSLTMRSWAQWAHDHLKPFPRLIRENSFGVVVVRQSVRFDRPFNFFSGDGFDVRSTVSVRQKRGYLFGEVEFLDNERRFALLECVMRPLVIDHEADLGATSGTLKDDVFAMFEPDEVMDQRIDRPMREIRRRMSALTALAVSDVPIKLHRQECEAADQWSFIEVGSLSANSREDFVLTHISTDERLRPGITADIESIDIEIYAPMYLFDDGVIRTSAFLIDDKLVFKHDILSGSELERHHATVMETLPMSE